jgi:hypothetical protein
VQDYGRVIPDYKGFRIKVTEWGSFEAEGFDSTFTLSDLRKRIDEFLRKRARSRKLELPTQDADGFRRILTGIDARTGRFRVTPDALGRDVLSTGPGLSVHVYPDTAVVSELQAELAEVRKRWHELQEELQKYAVQEPRLGNESGADAYAEALGLVERTYELARERAEAAAAKLDRFYFLPIDDPHRSAN